MKKHEVTRMIGDIIGIMCNVGTIVCSILLIVLKVQRMQEMHQKETERN